jgi:ankyrin repeat protein
LGALEPEIGLGQAAKFRRTFPDGFGSLACYYDLLQHVLLRWPKSGPRDVFRGVKMESNAMEEYAEHVGDLVRWSGLVSTSLSRRVAAGFGNVLFVIHAADCACIADAAAHRGEREVLFLPGSYFVILRVTRDSFGGAEIELRDVFTDPDFARGLTPAEARLLVLGELEMTLGRDRAESVIDRAEGMALVNQWLRGCPFATEEDIELAAAGFLAASAAYRANPGRDEEIRGRQRAEALRRLREDPQALFDAAKSPKPNWMRRVIAAGAALDVQDRSGLTAAMIAACVGSWRVLPLLIDAGADVTVSRDRRAWTALHHAAMRGRARSVRVLLEAGVALEARTSDGLTALALAAHANQPAVVEILLRAGAAVDAGYLEGVQWWTPLHLAAAAGNADVVRILLGGGADPSSQGSGLPFSPLDAAIANRSTSVIRLLVEAGADLEAKGRTG